MKNPTILRLTLIGIFGMTHLSPASMEKGWLMTTINPGILSIDRPATYFAFNQETNYSENIDVMAEQWQDNPQAQQQAGSALPTNNHLIKLHKKEKQDSFPNGKKMARKQSSSLDNSPSQSGTPAPIVKDEDIIYYNPAEKAAGNYTSLPAASELTSMFQEEILPPATYVDEVSAHKFQKNTKPAAIISNGIELAADSYPEHLMEARMLKLADEAEKANYSAEYAFLINLGLKSGKKRFFIVDLKKRSIISSGLVAHGRGTEKFTLDKKYSNRSGSSCSSLGFYKVGASYHGSFGKSFRLIGLNSTNSNATSRAIVLHSMNCIPDEEIDYPICQSEGCPSVSENFLEQLSDIIQASKKPILLWVFDPAVDEDLKP